MSIIQTVTAGAARFRLLKGGKRLQLDSTAPFGVPSIFGGCPVPEPPAPPEPAPEPELLAGFGPRADVPYPASPGDPAWSSAGFLVSTESVDWSPLMCEDSADVWLDLEPGPVEWSTEADGLQLETRLNWYHDPAPMQQSLWCGLASADRSTLIAVGVQGERGMVGQCFSVLLKINGIVLLNGGSRIGTVPLNTAPGVGLRLLIQPMSGSTSRAVTLQAWDATAARWEAWNPDGSLFALTQGEWLSLLGSLAAVGGSLRPVLGVTHREFGPTSGTYCNFTRFRFA